MEPIIWLTYDELAERLGIERESARQQVKRKRWARQPGNDGKVRIGVPEELLATGPSPDTKGGTEPACPPVQEPVQALVQSPALSEVLTRHIERLELALGVATNRAADRAALAAERDVLAVQVEALRAALAVAEQDRDRWHEAATRPPVPSPHRPWWRRLAG